MSMVIKCGDGRIDLSYIVGYGYSVAGTNRRAWKRCR